MEVLHLEGIDGHMFLLNLNRGLPRDAAASNFVKQTKKGADAKTTSEIADFLFVDNINTILDPNASTFDKGLAVLNLSLLERFSTSRDFYS